MNIFYRDASKGDRRDFFVEIQVEMAVEIHFVEIQVETIVGIYFVETKVEMIVE